MSRRRDPDRLLTTSVVAEELGLSRGTIETWARNGTLPALKFGRVWRIRRSAFEAWQRERENGRPTAVELERLG